MNPDGSISITTQFKSTTPLPVNPEQLRTNIKTMEAAWDLVKLQLPQSEAIQELSAETWTDHLDFILGEDVLGKKVITSDGATTFKTPWLAVLEMEFQLRRQPAHLANATGKTFAQGMAAARSDDRLMRDCLTTPMYLSPGLRQPRVAALSRRTVPPLVEVHTHPVTPQRHL